MAPERTVTAGPPAGYSSTPLARKLGVKAHQHLLLYRAPAGWSVPDLPEGALVTTSARRAEIAVAFFYRADELIEQAPSLVEVVKPSGALWVAWPRRAGGHTSDITDNVLRKALLPLGVVDVKVAALDRDWSGLKFVWRRQVRD